MGDVRYASYYERLRSADDPAAAIRDLSDEGIIAALAAASERHDPYLANVLATEALNRVSRARAVSDSIAEGVFAIDLRGRVTFMNPRAETLLGWRLEQVSGRSMHDVIHRERPDGGTLDAEDCPVLNAVDIMESVRIQSDWFRKRDGSFLPVSYAAVPVLRDGAPVGTVVTFHDETERRAAVRALKDRLEFESTVASVATLLASAAEPASAIGGCLEKIGHASGAHRAYLFELRPEGDVLDNTHEWVAEGVEPQLSQLQGVRAEAVPWWMDRMRRGEVVHVADVKALPSEARAEREILESQGIRSILAFPVHVGGALAGFMGFDDVEDADAWAPEDLRLLSITAANVGTALERWRNESELRARAERQAALARFGQDALRAQNLGEVMDEAVRVVSTTLGVPLCKVLELESDGEHLRLRAGLGWRDGLVGKAHVDAGADSQAGHTLLADEPVVVEDLATESRFRGPPLLVEHGVVSGVSVLIPGTGSHAAWGVLGAHTTRHRVFTEDEVHFLQAMANTIAAAVERDASERARRANEDRFERIIQDVPAGLMLLDREGDVAFSNPAAERILGSALRARSVSEWELTTPAGDPLPSDEWPFHQVLRSGRPVRGVEAWLHRVDGSRVFLNLNLVPLRNAGDKVTGVLAAFTDATQLQEQRQRLVELQQVQEEIVENVPAGVLYLDRDGRITYENSFMLRTMGAPEGADDVRGKRIFDLPPMKNHAAFTKKVHRLLDEGQPFEEHEEQYRSIYGREAVLSASGVPLYGNGKGARDVKGGLLLVRDVTDSRRVEEHVRRLNAELERRVTDRTRELAAANEELEAFSFSVSHDIRAPLRGIEYFTRVLEEDYAERLDPAGREYLERLHNESSRLTTLVNDLLEFSRAGREEVTRETVHVSAVAEDVVRKLEETDPSRAIRVDVAPDLTAHADPRLVRVVMDNLVSNAWKFTARKRDARVEVGATTRADGERAFFVRDNGAGFDPEKAKELFVPFRRLHAESEFKGTGIGLATVARIVHRHGGTVWAEGAPGEGAVFYFTLPDGP